MPHLIMREAFAGIAFIEGIVAVAEAPAAPSPGILLGLAALAASLFPFYGAYISETRARREAAAKKAEASNARALEVERARNAELRQMIEGLKVDHAKIEELNKRIERLIDG